MSVQTRFQGRRPDRPPTPHHTSSKVDLSVVYLGHPFFFLLRQASVSLPTTLNQRLTSLPYPSSNLFSSDHVSTKDPHTHSPPLRFWTYLFSLRPYRSNDLFVNFPINMHQRDCVIYESGLLDVLTYLLRDMREVNIHCFSS